MYRGTTEGCHGYDCKECPHMHSHFEEVLIEEFLHQKADWMRWLKIIEVSTGAATNSMTSSTPSRS